MVYNKENFNKHINTIIPDGFNQVGTYCMFQKEMNNRIKIIYYSHRDYFPHGVYIEGASVEIVFPEVENILNRILDKHNIQQRYGNSTIHSALNDIAGVDYSKFETKIHDEASFQIVAEEIKKIIEYGAMPFFEKYKTLEEIYKHAKQLSLGEYSQFFSGYGSFKMMIIKRLLKINDYEDYSKKIVQDWIKTTREYPQHFMNIDKVVVELKDVLDKL